MAVVIPGITLPLEAGENEAFESAAKLCGVFLDAGVRAFVCRRSVDARGGRVKIVRSVALEGGNDAEMLETARKNGAAGARLLRRQSLDELIAGIPAARHGGPAPVVAGFGPAGMFAALVLARRGLCPVVLERGGSMEERDGAVAGFYAGGQLDENSNIQFGEGGAGTYSDGKLTTRINDPICAAVTDELIAHGAPPETAVEARPHIGTDLLKNIVVSIRKEIERLGGRVLFNTAFLAPVIKNGALSAVLTSAGEIEANRLILAPGHSARDTFSALLSHGVELVPKSFALGVRIEHLQSEIDRSMYGRFAGDPRLGHAEYALSYKGASGGAFSFCMCPGGEVCAASSERGGVVTNGMSYHARAGKNGNACIAVTADASAFPPGPLGGAELSRRLEAAAFGRGGNDYTAPAQLAGDFLADRPSGSGKSVVPTYPRGVAWGKIDDFLIPGGGALLREALAFFARRVRCFGDPDAVLTAPETRTSSPVRILRGPGLESVSVRGLIPCGEGAGYAGGIMSAAADGVRAGLAV